MTAEKRQLRGPEAGGVDPRLLEVRESQREAEAGVVHAEPGTIDPKLAEIREVTIKREKELADRDLKKPPART